MQMQIILHDLKTLLDKYYGYYYYYYYYYYYC